MTSGHGNSYDGATSSDLLTVVSNQLHTRRTAEIREWTAIVAWAENNLHEGSGERHVDDVVAALDTGTQLAGPGTPKVSEFALMELVAVLERSPESGRFHVARILECAWRLPQVYEAVCEGRLALHKAARIAEQTLHLSPEAATFVDGQLFNAHRVTWAQLDRLIEEAAKRFDPSAAEADRQDRTTHLRVQMSEVTPEGLVYVEAVLDAADANDTNSAIARRAELRARLGDDGSLDQRRARGLGDLARADLELDLLTTDADGQGGDVRMPARKAEVVVHITPDTFTGDNPVARWNQHPVSAEQIKEWLRTCSTVIVRPVVDLADCEHVDSYEIPDRLRRHVDYRDHTCRFPGCTRTAARCDLDHRQPHGEGGPTCPCNLTPLCRRHHRTKTHSRWRYRSLRPGVYEWTSPTGRHFLVTPQGTQPTASDPRPPP